MSSTTLPGTDAGSVVEDMLEFDADRQVKGHPGRFQRTRACPRRRCQAPMLGASSRTCSSSMQIDKLKGTLVDFNELEHVLDDAARHRCWERRRGHARVRCRSTS